MAWSGRRSIDTIDTDCARYVRSIRSIRSKAQKFRNATFGGIQPIVPGFFWIRTPIRKNPTRGAFGFIRPKLAFCFSRVCSNIKFIDSIDHFPYRPNESNAAMVTSLGSSSSSSSLLNLNWFALYRCKSNTELAYLFEFKMGLVSMNGPWENKKHPRRKKNGKNYFAIWCMLFQLTHALWART